MKGSDGRPRRNADALRRNEADASYEQEISCTLRDGRLARKACVVSCEMYWIAGSNIPAVSQAESVALHMLDIVEGDDHLLAV